MKLLLALALCVGAALGLGGGSSTAYYGWTPGQELVYRFETEAISGIPEIRPDQFSGLKLAANVVIQTRNDYSIVCKFEEPKVVMTNGQLEMVHGVPVMPRPSEEVPEPLRKHLVEPFLVHLKAGVVESFYVSQEEPVVVTNIKKALLSQVQLDLTASRRGDVAKTNLIPGGSDDEAEIEPGKTFFTTEESSLGGDCQVNYNVMPMPAYEAKALEATWEQQESAMRRAGVLSGPHGEGKRACEGKQYWTIFKTDNYDNCRQRPVYVQRQGMKTACDVGKAGCKDSFTTTGSAKLVVCGTPDRFTIRQIGSQNTGLVNIIGINTEKTASLSRVSLFLVKAGRGGRFEPLSMASGAGGSKKVETLIMEYPEGHIWSSQSSITPMKVSEGGETEFAAVRPAPGLHQPDNIYPSAKTAAQIVEGVIKMLTEVVEQIGSAGRPCGLTSELAGKLSAIVNDVRFLTYSEIQGLEQKVRSAFGAKGALRLALAEQLFYDMLAQTGTNPAVMIVKEKLQTGAVRGGLQQKMQLVQTLIRSVRTPTEPLLRELVGLVKSLKGLKSSAGGGGVGVDASSLYYTGMNQLSTLFYRACVDPSTAVSNYPVRIYGRLCTVDSGVLVDEYIPYLSGELERIESRGQRLAILSALGKTGHKRALLPLTRAVEGRFSQKPIVRSLAVYSLRRVAKQQPTLVKPVLLALVDNLAENTEVRIAAISVLPYAQPSTAELQKIAVRSWFEPSKQVTSFLHSTFKSLTETGIPELKAVGERCRTLVSLVKPFQYGIQFSHNSHFESFARSLGVGNKLKYSVVKTAEALVPTRGAVSFDLYGAGLWEVKRLDWTLYTLGMDGIVEKLANLFDLHEVSPIVQRELETITRKLNIKPRGASVAPDARGELFSQFRMFDLESVCHGRVDELVHEVASALKSESGLSAPSVRAMLLMQGEVLMPTSSGFPVLFENSSPVVYSTNSCLTPATVRAAEHGYHTKITPSVSMQVVNTAGVLCPFSQYYLGTGAEIAFHAALPLNLDMKLRGLEKLTVKMLTPEEAGHHGDFEMLHTKVRGFTFIKDCHRPGPVTESSDLKEILTGKPVTENTYEFGKYSGLESELKVCTDYPTYDFAYNYEILKETGIGGLAGLIPKTLKKLDVLLTYKPTMSKTKEIVLTIDLINGRPSVNGPWIEPTPILDMISGKPVTPLGSETPYGYNPEKEIRDICLQTYPSGPRAERCIEMHAQPLSESSMVVPEEQIREVCAFAEPLHGEQKALCKKAAHVCYKAGRICEESDSSAFESRLCEHVKKSCIGLKKTVVKTLGVWKTEREVPGLKTRGLHIGLLMRKKYGASEMMSLSVVRGSTGSASGRTVRTFWDFAVETGSGSPRCEAELTTKAEMPEVLYRWNIDALLRQPIEMKFDAELKYGVSGQPKTRLGMKTVWRKDAKLIEAVRHSPEYRKCVEEERLMRPLSSVCMETRHQAASVNAIDATVYYPTKLVASNYLLMKLYNGLKWTIMSNVELPAGLVSGIEQQQQQQQELPFTIGRGFYGEEDEQLRFFPGGEESEYIGGRGGNSGSSESEVLVKARFDRVGSAFNATVKSTTPAGFPEHVLRNVRVPESLTGLMPLSVRNGVYDRLIQKLTRDQAPASCSINRDVITTFDNRTYSYELCDCDHLIFKDCSGVRPVAVLGRKEPTGSLKVVKAMLGLHTVELKRASSSGGSAVEILVDGHRLALPQAQLYEKTSPKTGRVVLKIYVNKDGVVSVENPEEAVIVFFDGERVEVVAPQTLHNKACGLCGDLNLETTADLKGPQECVYSEDKLFGYSYMMPKRVGSSGAPECVPSGEQRLFASESRECSRVRTVATPVHSLAARLVAVAPRPTAVQHLVHKEANRVCFSRRVQKVCSGHDQAHSVEMPVPFSCFTWPSSKGAQMLKRAHAGEILVEAMYKPVVFSKTMSVVVRCGEKPAFVPGAPVNYRIGGRGY